MSTAPLTEDELPVDPATFAERVVGEIDAFIEEHDLGAPRFDQQRSPEEMREGLYTRVYNEIMAADVPRDMLNDAERFENPQIFVHLLKQIEDEAKHARLLAQRLANLGGDPAACFERASRSPFWEGFEALDAVEQAATLQGAGERMAKARHPNELQYYDAETAQIYEDVIVPEEQFHAKIGEHVLRHCTDRDSQLAALRRARAVQELLLQHNEGNAEEYAEA
ncbi:MAG: ferritin-like domain-containing protein [Haloferacaceae archaeon]